MILSVFTEKYNTIQKRIVNQAVVEYGQEYQPVVAQWDTGAEATCISNGLVERFNMKPTGQISVRSPYGSRLANLYEINLILNNEVIIQNISVTESDIDNQGIDVLIGMDIISMGDFIISNYNNQTQFSFQIPSQYHIEFSKES